MCHLHFTSNSLPHITSVTESERMQLQVVLKLLWGRNKHLDSLKTALVVFVMWNRIFEDTLWRFGLVSRTCFYMRHYPDRSKSRVQKKKKVDLMMSGLFCFCNMRSVSVYTSMHSKSILISYPNHYFHAYLFIAYIFYKYYHKAFWH